MLPPMPPPQAMPATPSFASLAGPMGGGAPDPTAGGNQIGSALVKTGVEIDQALKLLAKMAPSTAEWVLKTTLELQQQIGLALQSGQAVMDGSQDSSFPDGSSRMSGLMG